MAYKTPVLNEVTGCLELVDNVPPESVPLLPYVALPVGTNGDTVCAGNDARLSNARTPTAHAHVIADITDYSGAGPHNTTHQNGGTDEIDVGGLSGVLADPQPPIIGASGTQAVAGNDSRLTNARTPTAHASTHVTGGSDVIASVVAAGNAGLMTGSDKTKLDGVATGATANSTDATLLNRANHTGSQAESTITNLVSDLAGKQASLGFTAENAANKNAISGYAGLDGASKLTGTQQVYGSAANTACQGNDTRLSDARTPTTHASSHVTGGSDVVANVVAAGNSGLMTGSDKTKLDGIATSANNYSHPNHSGDVTSVGDGAQTIAANVVTNAKAAQMATKTYKGRTTAGTGNAEDVAVATLKTDLALVKADVGLGSVDNTADSAKPVSTAQQTALDLKANLASPTFTGTVVVPDASWGLAKLANVATSTVFYRKTAGTGVPEVNTLATLKTDLALVKADVGLGNVENTALSTWAGSTNLTTLGTIASGTWNATAIGISKGGTGQTTAGAGFNALAPSKTGNALKLLRVNAGETDYELVALSGGGDALVANPLSQFAATTSLQLKGVISDETGSGALVFGTSPNITTPTGIVKGDVGLGNADNTSDANKPISSAEQTALNLKADLASPTFSGTPSLPTGTTGITQSAADSTTKLATTAFVTTADNLKANLAGPTFTGVPAAPTAAVDTNTTQLATTAFVIGQAYAKLAGPTLTGVPAAPTAAVDTNTTQLATTAYVIGQTYGKLASPTFTGTPAAPTAAAGTNTTQVATTAYVVGAVPNASYRAILQASGSHTAAKVAGTYGLGQGDPLAVSGTGTLYPLATINIVGADYPTVNGLAPKLRIRWQLYANDVAPFTGTFIIGLYPITRPATSGGAGLCIYTLGTVVSGSQSTFTNVAADSSNAAAGADFALPADGHYVLGVVTNQTMATSSHVQVSASLQMRNA